MWCVDTDNQCLSNREGVRVYFNWSTKGELKQALNTFEPLSSLRREQLFAETGLLLKQLHLRAEQKDLASVG